MNRPPMGEACLVQVCHDLQGRQENILNSSLVGPLSYRENHVLQSIFGKTKQNNNNIWYLHTDYYVPGTVFPLTFLKI